MLECALLLFFIGVRIEVVRYAKWYRTRWGSSTTAWYIPTCTPWLRLKSIWSTATTWMGGSSYNCRQTDQNLSIERPNNMSNSWIFCLYQMLKEGCFILTSFYDHIESNKQMSDSRWETRAQTTQFWLNYFLNFDQFQIFKKFKENPDRFFSQDGWMDFSKMLYDHCLSSCSVGKTKIFATPIWKFCWQRIIRVLGFEIWKRRWKCSAGWSQKRQTLFYHLKNLSNFRV